MVPTCCSHHACIEDTGMLATTRGGPHSLFMSKHKQLVVILQDWLGTARPCVTDARGFSADTVHQSTEQSMLEVQRAEGKQSRRAVCSWAVRSCSSANISVQSEVCTHPSLSEPAKLHMTPKYQQTSAWLFISAPKSAYWFKDLEFMQLLVRRCALQMLVRLL